LNGSDDNPEDKEIQAAKPIAAWIIFLRTNDCSRRSDCRPEQFLASHPSTENMASQKQQAAAKGNIKKAAAAAKPGHGRYGAL